MGGRTKFVYHNQYYYILGCCTPTYYGQMSVPQYYPLLSAASMWDVVFQSKPLLAGLTFKRLCILAQLDGSCVLHDAIQSNDEPPPRGAGVPLQPQLYRHQHAVLQRGSCARLSVQITIPDLQVYPESLPVVQNVKVFQNTEYSLWRKRRRSCRCMSIVSL